MPSIVVDNISFSYGRGDVLSSLSFRAEGSCHISILGSNGSGKSTLVRLIDGLLPLRRGDILVNGISVKDEKSIREIRKSIAIIFQDPDSQFVSPVLEEDTAFGPENYEMENIDQIVSRSLSAVSLSDFRKRVPQTLSGGEKERAQIAGALAVNPDIVLLDESFSMLDDAGRKEMDALVGDIWKERLIISITHSADQAINSDRVILLSGGKLIADGSPREVLCSVSLLRKADVRPPFAVRVRESLKERGISIPPILTTGELKEVLWNFR